MIYQGTKGEAFEHWTFNTQKSATILKIRLIRVPTPFQLVKILIKRTYHFYSDSFIPLFKVGLPVFFKPKGKGGYQSYGYIRSSYYQLFKNIESDEF